MHNAFTVYAVTNEHAYAFKKFTQNTEMKEVVEMEQEKQTQQIVIPLSDQTYFRSFDGEIINVLFRAELDDEVVTYWSVTTSELKVMSKKAFEARITLTSRDNIEKLLGEKFGKSITFVEARAFTHITEDEAYGKDTKDLFFD